MNHKSLFPIGISTISLLTLCQISAADQLNGLKIKTPASKELLAGQQLQLAVDGIFNNGTRSISASQVEWAATPSGIVSISADGVISISESRGMGGPGGPGGPGEGGNMGMPPQGNPGGPGFDNGMDMGDPFAMGGPEEFNGNNDMATMGAQGGPGNGMGTPPDRPGNGMGMGGPGGNDSMGMPPQGAPGGQRGTNNAMGMPPQGNPGGMNGSNSSKLPQSTVKITASSDGITSKAITLIVKTAEGPAIYTQNGEQITKDTLEIITEEPCTSAIKVSGKGILTVTNATLKTSGNTANMENSSFYGLNAGVLAMPASTIKISDSSITTTGTGANGAFAVGTGSQVELQNVKINCTASGAHGIDATINGTVLCTDVNIHTAGDGASAAISTDRGSGTIVFTRGTAFTSGSRSPGIYSTGNITVTDAVIEASGSEAIVIEGKNNVTLKNTKLTCKKECGAMLYQSFSGDAGVGTSILDMTGGSLHACVGPMFKITNTDAIIKLQDNAVITADSGILIEAAANRWGHNGSNGGKLSFYADGEQLDGDVTCDNISSVEMTLTGKTSYSGSINNADTDGHTSLKLSADSTWNVTADSHLSAISNSNASLTNITGNGHTVYYDPSDSGNKWLNNNTISLTGGGKLCPE